MQSNKTSKQHSASVHASMSSASHGSRCASINYYLFLCLCLCLCLSLPLFLCLLLSLSFSLCVSVSLCFSVLLSVSSSLSPPHIHTNNHTFTHLGCREKHPPTRQQPHVHTHRSVHGDGNVTPGKCISYVANKHKTQAHLCPNIAARQHVWLF